MFYASRPQPFPIKLLNLAPLHDVLKRTSVDNQWRIQDFPDRQHFAENYTKMKEFGRWGGPGASLDPPLTILIFRAKCLNY